MKYFLDSEFMESGPENPIRLISIALVCEDGREFYAETEDAKIWAARTSWLSKNVLPHLGHVIPLFREELARQLKDFLLGKNRELPKPEIWGYFADYDWVVFCQIFGAMVDLPKGMPYFCRDLKQEMARLGIKREDLPPDSTDEHNALVDARWIKDAYYRVVGE